MDLTHEEKLIAMKGFQDSLEKDASMAAVKTIVPKLKAFGKAVVNKTKKGRPVKGTEAWQSAGKKVYDNRGKAIAATGVGGTALVMKD